MTDLEYVNRIRAEEMRRVLERHAGLFTGKDLLEIGSGTGLQLQALQKICQTAIGIDLASSSYSQHRLVDIVDYDGQHIPFPDHSFDIIFSSNVLEHIAEEAAIHTEMKRVLRPGGAALHIMPTHTWRILTSVAHYPAQPRRIASRLFRQNDGPIQMSVHSPTQRQWFRTLAGLLLPSRHGEFGNLISEHWIFHPNSWRKRFERWGWKVEAVEPLELAYTGHGFFGPSISLDLRTRWSHFLGSSTALFILRPRLISNQECKKT